MKISKDHIDYWKAKVFIRPSCSQYSVRIQRSKRREVFNLNTANKTNAAHLAKEVWYYILANGMDGAVLKYKDGDESNSSMDTIGDLIKKAESSLDVNPKTLRQYKSALRNLGSQLKGIKDSQLKYSCNNPEWRDKVDKIALSTFSEEKIKQLKSKKLKGLDPLNKRQAEISFNSTINKAKSIWKVSELESPFKSFKWKQTTNQFNHSIEPGVLLYNAQKELKKTNFEAYKAFCLMLYLGLRKAEADTLVWNQVDLDNSLVNIKVTQYFKPKSEDSIRSIPINKNLLKELKSWVKNSSVFVLEGLAPKINLSYDYYRADKTFKYLIKWMKEQGIESYMPLHYLRKVAGSLQYKAIDIYAAKRFLGQSDIRTTSSSYLDAGKETFELNPIVPESTSG